MSLGKAFCIVRETKTLPKSHSWQLFFLIEVLRFLKDVPNEMLTFWVEIEPKIDAKDTKNDWVVTARKIKPKSFKMNGQKGDKKRDKI